MKLKPILAAGALALSLAACGGPSDSDVEKALRQQLAPLAAMGMFGGQGGDSLASLQIIVGDKTKRDDGTYSVVVTVKGKGGDQTVPLHMIKGADGWVVTNTP